jgi:hypothetical protein
MANSVLDRGESGGKNLKIQLLGYRFGGGPTGRAISESAAGDSLPPCL